MYRASAILRSAGVDPEVVGASCGLADPDCTPVKPAPKWLVASWRGPVAAMTVPWAVYVRADVLTGDRKALAHLLQHELVHVRQWSEFGAVGFLKRYIGGYLDARRMGLSHDEAYRAIPLEEEARRIGGH